MNGPTDNYSDDTCYKINTYYLYREIDPDSVKPISLFIVNKDILETVEIVSSPAINNTIGHAEICEKIAKTPK